MSHIAEDAIASPVEAVMTTNVSTVRPDTPFKVIAAQLHERRVGAFPVVTGTGHVLGVVSAADLLAKAAQPDWGGHDGPHMGHRHRELQQARALTAADLMTSPAVTVGAHASVQHAAQLMSGRHVKRLPVVDPDGRLVGIISRSDVLAVFRRPDEQIRQAIARDVITDEFFVDPASFTVTVTDGIVTLASPPELSPLRRAIAQQARHLEGVVAVRERTF